MGCFSVCLFVLALTSHHNMGFPDCSTGKESARNAKDSSSIPGLERSPEEGKGYPLQYSGLENSMDWIVHGVTKNQTQLSDFLFFFSTHHNSEYISLTAPSSEKL